MKNVIVAPAFFYRFGQLEPFVKSHLRAGVNGRILFVIEKKKTEFEEAAKRYGNFDVYVAANVEKYTSRQQKLLAYPSVWIRAYFTSSTTKINKVEQSIKPWILQALHISLKRYLIALNLLTTELNDTDLVMLTDTRDVVFQSDPFEKIQNGLYCGLESIKIGYEYNNRTWIDALYHGDVQKYLHNQIASCSGVTLGDRSSVQIYLQKMVCEILRKLPQVCFRPAFDQGIHNYVIYQDHSGLDISYMKNGDSLIATLGSSLLQEFLIKDGKIYTRNEELVSILHQYQPHPELRKSIALAYE